MSMGPSRRTAGFSLIELMVVVTIISILVLSVRSSFHKSLAQKHTAAAATDLVRLARRARADSVGLGRAHLVYFQPGAGKQGFGQATLLRGNAMHCDHDDWGTIASDCEDTLTQVKMTGQRPTSCIERVDLNSSHWFHSPHAIVVRELAADGTIGFAGPSATATRSLCYDAFGKVQWSRSDLASAMTFSHASLGTATFTGAFVFGVGLFDANTRTSSVPTLILSFPLGGNPRRLR